LLFITSSQVQGCTFNLANPAPESSFPGLVLHGRHTSSIERELRGVCNEGGV
jgi:hypothetical protein